MFKHIIIVLVAVLALLALATTALAGKDDDPVEDPVTTLGGVLPDGDLFSGGENSWRFHTPDWDERTSLYIAPGVNGTDWDWSRGFEFRYDSTLFARRGYRWGAYKGQLTNDQGASMELGGSGAPYIDFTNDTNTDYDIRLRLSGDNELSLEGGDLNVKGFLRWGGGRSMLSSNQGGAMELGGNGNPYIDFSNDLTSDFDMRVALGGDNELAISGGALKVHGGGTFTGVLTTNGGAYVGGDAILSGSNSWILHTPDDDRTTMHFAPKTNGAWDWAKQTTFYNNGDVRVSGNGIFLGTVTTGSSRELKNNISQLTGNEAIDALMSLIPVKYNYKTNADELELGFIAEDVPELVARNDRKSLSPMDFAALSVTVIQELKKENQQHQDQMNLLLERIAVLEAAANNK